MNLLRRVKEALYFPLAYYFRFFAHIRLWLWKPRVIVITGSSGKTTLFKLVESQLRGRAYYSHKANSSYGIAFNILGLERKTFFFYEWFFLFLLAPIALFRPLPKEKIYVVEVDCDRPGEGKFLATLLRPAITLWLNSSRTHSMNFDKAVHPPTGEGRFDTIEEAVAHEFGYLLACASEFAIVNGDSRPIMGELGRAKAGIQIIHKAGRLEHYEITEDGQTRFRIDTREHSFDYLLPEDVFYSIAMAVDLTLRLGLTPDHSFSAFTLPPGRSSIFRGIKNITIVDSSYNANLDSMRVVLDMFNRMPVRQASTSAEAMADRQGKPAQKWAVLGDMIEQGRSEKEEHEKLAELLVNYNLDQVILMGPRMVKYTYPRLETLASHFSPMGIKKIEKFINPVEVLEYLKANIKGGETILFKGARFLEGVVEHLLADRADVKKLCRQEKVWKIRRKQWGL